MPKYITFFSYSSGAVASMIGKPSDRAAAARALVKSLGGKMEAFYWMQGTHDGFLITELPDGVTGTALSAAVASTGAVTNLQSHEIFGTKEQSEIVKKAQKALAAYKPPTA